MNHAKYHPLRANRNIKNNFPQYIFEIGNFHPKTAFIYSQSYYFRENVFNVSICPKGMIFGVIHLISIYYKDIKKIPKKVDPSGHNDNLWPQK